MITLLDQALQERGRTSTAAVLRNESARFVAVPSRCSFRQRGTRPAFRNQHRSIVIRQLEAIADTALRQVDVINEF